MMSRDCIEEVRRLDQFCRDQGCRLTTVKLNRRDMADLAAFDFHAASAMHMGAITFINGVRLRKISDGRPK